VFIEENKDDVVDGRRLGVEPICETLQVASSTYYAVRDRPPSARARRDAKLTPRLVKLWKDNYQVYGSRKLWKTARRAGIEIGRDQTARLMRQAGIQGVLRCKRVRTTRRDEGAGRHPDLVQRQFTASNPNELWVTDLTFVPTWAGVAYVCFIVDAFSRLIVGWRVAGHMRTPMVLDAIEMARWSRGLHHQGLRCHSDAGSQFTSIRYGERLAEIGAVPSIGSVGDSFDNALAETVNGYYKAELIRGPPALGRGRLSRRSSSPRSAGCTGTTPSASTATSATYRPPSSRSSTPRRPSSRPPIRWTCRSQKRLAGPQIASQRVDPIPKTLRSRLACFQSPLRSLPRSLTLRRPPEKDRIDRRTSTTRNSSTELLRYPSGHKVWPGNKTPEPPSKPGRFTVDRTDAGGNQGVRC
jgi:putative transposase